MCLSIQYWVLLLIPKFLVMFMTEIDDSNGETLVEWNDVVFNQTRFKMTWHWSDGSKKINNIYFKSFQK